MIPLVILAVAMYFGTTVVSAETTVHDTSTEYVYVIPPQPLKK